MISPARTSQTPAWRLKQHRNFEQLGAVAVNRINASSFALLGKQYIRVLVAFPCRRYFCRSPENVLSSSW